MELKLNTSGECRFGAGSSNCTNMELKRAFWMVLAG